MVTPKEYQSICIEDELQEDKKIRVGDVVYLNGKDYNVVFNVGEVKITQPLSAVLYWFSPLTEQINQMIVPLSILTKKVTKLHDNEIYDVNRGRNGLMGL